MLVTINVYRGHNKCIYICARRVHIKTIRTELKDLAAPGPNLFFIVSKAPATFFDPISDDVVQLLHDSCTSPNVFLILVVVIHQNIFDNR